MDFGASWGGPGHLLGRLGASWGRLGGVLGLLGGVLGRLGVVLGAPWGVLERLGASAASEAFLKPIIELECESGDVDYAKTTNV